MKEVIIKIEKELEEARKRCSTSNSFDYAYSYGLEFALNQIKNTPCLKLDTHSKI